MTLLAGGVLILSSALVATPAGASGDLSYQDTLNALSAAGAFDGALSSATHQDGSTTSALSSGETVSLPSTGAGALRVSDGSNQVDLGLPLGTSSSAGVEIAPSSTLYTSSSHFSVAATLTTSEMRESVTLENSSAPSSYSLPVTLSPGEFLASNPDGTVSVMHGFSGGSISVGTFEAPWAKDATGALVPTSSSVQGSTLVQTVQTTSSTVFPVVADPIHEVVRANAEAIGHTAKDRRILLVGPAPHLVGRFARSRAIYVMESGVVDARVSLRSRCGLRSSILYCSASERGMP